MGKIRGYCYMATTEDADAVGLFKIGYTQFPSKRLYGLRGIGSPYRVSDIILWIPSENPQKLERELHERFSDKRVINEWFSLSDDDISYLEELSDE